MSTTITKPNAMKALFSTALQNARLHREATDDSALRRMCIYYACDVAGRVWESCPLEMVQQISNSGHRLANIIIAGTANEDPIQTKEAANANCETDVNTFLHRMTDHRTELSPNAFLMMKEFKISQVNAIELMSMVKDNIRTIIEQ